MNTETFSVPFFELLDETFEKVHGNYLDKGTSLFETLAGVSAAEASRPVSAKGATIAAHVSHVEFYLTIIGRVLQGEDLPKVDWTEIWRTTREVSPSEWDDLRQRLRHSYARVLARLRSGEDWDGKNQMSAALALLAHNAYHLGAIRQALRVAGDPGRS